MIQDKFMEYCNKRFNPGDLVTVHSLGPSMPDTYQAEVVGVHAFEPHESYIIRWVDGTDKRYPHRDGKHWPCSVMTKGCMTLTETV
jgi:hypothetical protein